MVDSMKLYGAEGVRYLEFQASPFNLKTPEGALIDEEAAAKLYEARLQQPDAKATGVEVRFLITGLRFAPDAEAQIKRIYAFLDRHRDRWSGLTWPVLKKEIKEIPAAFSPLSVKCAGIIRILEFRFTRAKWTDRIRTYATLSYSARLALVTA